MDKNSTGWVAQAPPPTTRSSKPTSDPKDDAVDVMSMETSDSASNFTKDDLRKAVEDGSVSREDFCVILTEIFEGTLVPKAMSSKDAPAKGKQVEADP